MGTEQGEECRPFWERPLLGAQGLKWELVAYIVLIAIALGLRLWDLGAKAYHHDESLHATFSWYLYVGRGYVHDPMMHGPFQFHGNALIFFLFGDSDFTARLLYAGFGTALVGLPFFLRDRLGRWGSLATAVMLTVSPSFLYFSRFARNDILMAVWTLALVIFMWRYWEEAKPRDLYGAVAVLSLGFATKENQYITVAVFGSFLLIITARELWGRVRNRLDLSSLSPPATLVIVIGTLSLPLGAAGSIIIKQLLGIDLSQVLFTPFGFVVRWENIIAALVVLLLFGIGAAIGLRWNLQLWLRCFLIFYGIFLVLYTTFFINMPGFGTGLWGSLSYWLVQQGVERGGQPWYYYLILLPVYEFLPLFFGLIAAVYYARKGSLFSRFLVYWAFLGLFFYSYAGEKMPWLVLHVALPFVLLAGQFIGQIWESIEWRRAVKAGGVFLIALLPLLLWGAWGMLKVMPPLNRAGLTLVLLVVMLVVFNLAWRLGWRDCLRLATLALLAILLAFTVRAAVQASFYRADIPVEMLVYTQSSPDIPRIMEDIERLSLEQTGGKDLRITVDAADGFSWPWAWYLRNYTKVDYPDLSVSTSAPTGDVLLLSASNVTKMAPYLGRYGPGQKYRHRWWFPEDYKGLTLQRLMDDLVNSKTRDQWWRYFISREPPSTLGSVDSYAYFPKDYIRSAAAP